jgi:hypothetical protein
MSKASSFSGGKVRQQREAPLDEKAERKDNTARKSELKKKRSGDDELLDITDMYVKDEQGNVEHHNVEVVHRKCSYVAGDYMPGHKNCDAPCSMRPLCATNAVANKRINVSEEFQEQMKTEAQEKYSRDYAAAKAAGKLLVPQDDKDMGGVPVVNKKPFPLKPRKWGKKKRRQ